MIQNVTKITLGKKAAYKMKDKNKDNSFEEENELDFEEWEEEELSEKEIEEKKRRTKNQEENRRVDPSGDIYIRVAKILGPNTELWNGKSYMEYFLAFLPADYIKEEMLPPTNKFAKENGLEKLFMYEEFIHVLGILYMMEVVESRMYWKTVAEGSFSGLCFSKVISIHCFDEFLNVWQLSGSDGIDQQVLNFIKTVTVNLKGAMRAGEVLCIEELMVKAFHKDLNGMMKIISKPQPISNELKTVSDASAHIVLHTDLHEPKEDMADKEYVKDYGARTACCWYISLHIGKVLLLNIVLYLFLWLIVLTGMDDSHPHLYHMHQISLVLSARKSYLAQTLWVLI